MAIVEIPTKDDKIISYFLEDKIKKIFDKQIIPSLHKKDKDCIIAIDGGEGCGKSTLAFQLAKYADNSFDLSRVCFTAEEFKNAIFRAEKGQAVVYDEAFTGLSSRSSLSGINKYLVSLMMQMRQKNLFVVIVLPTYFLLDKYVALFRTRALLHVYETGGRRGYYKVYNKKSKKYLYIIGKATMSYFPAKVRATILGMKFYGVFALGGKEIEEQYREKKKKALEGTENPENAKIGGKNEEKYKKKYVILLYLFKKKLNMTFDEISKLLAGEGIKINKQQMSREIREVLKVPDKNLIDTSMAAKEVEGTDNFWEDTVESAENEE